MISQTFLGFTYFSGLRGTDSLNALSYVYWFDKWFPRIPYWNPLQNGGIVPVWGYPQLAHFFVIIIHKIFNISLLSSFQILGFISLPLTSLGMYLFVWVRLKNQTLALIAAVFYLLSPISWVWLFTWGFYAESIACIFIFPTFLFYDIFYQNFIKGKITWKGRIGLLFAVIFLALAFLAHPNVFFISIAIIIVYSIVVSTLQVKRWKWKFAPRESPQATSPCRASCQRPRPLCRPHRRPGDGPSPGQFESASRRPPKGLLALLLAPLLPLPLAPG